LKLVHHRFKPAIAAGLVVVGLIALMTGVVVATVRGVTGQTDQIGASVDAALHKAVDALGVDQASLDAARAAVEKAPRQSAAASSPIWFPASTN
jgi:hypothetical protein